MDALRADGFDAYLIRPVRRRSLVSVIAEASRLPDRFISDPADVPGRLPAERRGNRPLDVLVVEDDPRLGPARPRRAGTTRPRGRRGADDRRRPREAPTDLPDVALVDLKLGDGDGLGLIAAFAAADGEAGRPAPIAMSGDAAARESRARRRRRSLPRKAGLGRAALPRLRGSAEQADDRFRAPSPNCMISVF